MKNSIFIIFILSFVYLTSCTSESEERDYITSFSNESNSSIEIKGYDAQANLVFDENVLTNENSSNCIASSESFLGVSCRIDSLVIKFENDKGYISTIFGENNLSFQGRNPLYGDEMFFNNLGNRTYEFVISQSDFENAFDLP